MALDVVLSETANHRHIGFRFAVCRGHRLLGIYGPAVRKDLVQPATSLGRSSRVGWALGHLRHQPAFE
jgi:hypothetical protein